jgi:plasmid maintenance system antidote protein VapI
LVVKAQNCGCADARKIHECVGGLRYLGHPPLRLARYFNTSAGFCMDLQTAYDLEVTADKLLPTIEREVLPAALVASSAVSG